MDPASLILTILSAGSRIAGGYYEAKGLKGQANAYEDVGEMEYFNARRAANYAKQQRLTEELSERRVSARHQALMQSVYAKAGVMMAGSPEKVIAEQAARDEQVIQQRNRESLYEQRLMRYRGRSSKIARENQAVEKRNEARGVLFQAIEEGIGIMIGQQSPFSPTQAKEDNPTSWMSVFGSQGQQAEGGLLSGEVSSGSFAPGVSGGVF